MHIPIEHDAFTRGRLAIRRGTFFRSPALVVDGERHRGKRGRHAVVDDDGNEREVRVRATAFDPLPRVEVDGKPVRIAPPLAWYEIALAVLPILSFLLAGLLGAAIGMGASYANIAILRGPGERAHKYVLMVLVLFAAAAASVALASAFWVWFEQRFPNVGA